jgi:hypothetical protein
LFEELVEFSGTASTSKTWRWARPPGAVEADTLVTSDGEYEYEEAGDDGDDDDDDK